MYPLDATKETFEAVEILGIPGLFTIERVNRATVPKGMYLYEMQTDEEDWTQPCLLGRRIIVEHFGTVLTASPITLNENGYVDLKPGDFTQGDGSDRLTMAEFEDRCFGRQSPSRQCCLRRHHKARTVSVR
ncbi:MAG: hypothetical protein HFF04_08380 [Oscillospiraceae bacterium]|nr:hypothetical protein [Oscillospiraceae bacterium]